MLYFETIESSTLDLLRGLMREPLLKDTRLVGGTALALQLGHRSSVDLDLFGHFSCDDIQLRTMLASYGKIQVISSSANVKIFTINDVKVDIVNYDSPWIEDIVVHEELRLASIAEIAAMKIRAIIGRGTKKDFVDIYYLLQQFSIFQIMDFYHKKYPDFNDFIAVKSLTFFDDAEQVPMPMMHDETSWETMKEQIKKSVKQLTE